MIKQILFIFSLALILFGCDNRKPTKYQIVGTWLSDDGGKLILKEVGIFLLESLPTGLFLREAEDKGKTFAGSGKWELNNDQSNWQLSLFFKQTSVEVYNFEMQLLISGEKGILENKPPWLLYLWKDQEGGDRYELRKQ